METITLTIRISPEVKKQIEIMAKNEDRSINNLINIILKKYIRENTHGKNL